MVEQTTKTIEETWFFHSSVWNDRNVKIERNRTPKKREIKAHEWRTKWEIEKETTRLIIESEKITRKSKKHEKRFTKQIEIII